MISTWSEWRRYPRPGRGDNLEAPISPGIYEVRVAGSGALHSFGAVDNLAQALALLSVGAKSWFGRRDAAAQPDLEYRTCATSTKADAKAAAERMIGRRDAQGFDGFGPASAEALAKGGHEAGHYEPLGTVIVTTDAEAVARLVSWIH